jgi:hypothetical protein
MDFRKGLKAKKKKEEANELMRIYTRMLVTARD